MLSFFLGVSFGVSVVIATPHLLSTRLSLLGRVLVFEESSIQGPIEFNCLRLNSIGGPMQLVLCLQCCIRFFRTAAKMQGFPINIAIFAVLSLKKYCYFNQL